MRHAPFRQGLLASEAMAWEDTAMPSSRGSPSVI